VGERLSLLSFLPFLSSPVHPENPVILSSSLQEESDKIAGREQVPGSGDTSMTYTGVIKQDGSDWIGWIEEIPGVNCQESTRETLEETLRITLKEALVFNRLDALSMAGAGYQGLAISVGSGRHS